MSDDLIRVAGERLRVCVAQANSDDDGTDAPAARARALYAASLWADVLQALIALRDHELQALIALRRHAEGGDRLGGGER